MPLPKIGDEIYVDTSMVNDGGLGRVTEIEPNEGVHMIHIEEVVGVAFLWEGNLEILQDELRNEFGSIRAQ